MTDTTTQDAPYGYKADGTPRKRAAPGSAGGRRANGRAPALSTGEAADILGRIARELDERIAALKPLADEHERLVAARGALSETG